MQLKNTSKRKYVFADFEIQAGETVEVAKNLEEKVKKLIETYKDLQIVTTKKVEAKAVEATEAK